MMRAMAAPLHFGWYIPTHGDGRTLGDPATFIPPTPELFLKVAKAAEAAGMEYCLVPVATGCWDAWISTAFVSAQTEKITMLVAARPGLIAPSVTAKMVATFDQMSRGRVAVNLIAGGGPEEMAADGLFISHDERYEFIDESVQLMKALWTAEGPLTWTGKHFRVENSVVWPKPYQQPYPKFYIGGISPAAQDVGSKHASVYMLWGNTPAQIAEDIKSVRGYAAKHGREHELEFCMRLQVLVREDGDQARRDAEALIANATEKARAARLTGMGAESHADGRMRKFAEEAAETNWWIAPHIWTGLTTVRHGAGVMVVGNPREVAETLQEFVDVGCTGFCLSGYTHDEEAERFGRLVMPYFRERVEG